MLNPMDFECPECGAKSQEPCHTISGKAMPNPHGKRLRAALDKEHPRFPLYAGGTDANEPRLHFALLLLLLAPVPAVAVDPERHISQYGHTP
jgi:hypothetical protein